MSKNRIKIGIIERGDLLLPPGADNHDAGTCRMGEDPLTSATNRYGQIHGISGLYVADNSLIPALVPVNPALTTAALAIRTADHIVRQLIHAAQ